MDKQLTVYERYKNEIYRIGWKVQYQAKKIRNRECAFSDSCPAGASFAAPSEETLWIRELINTLPPPGKNIIYKLYIQDLTEAEVAQQLHISQQAVNKWKRKMIQKLSRTVNS